jgi:BirA family biotin operon repressor/biotin-[acetyl-CoA-carboxylase] ligase
MNSSAKPADIWNLPTRRLGRRTIVFDRLDSTNTFAAPMADDPANDGLVIVAREQTAGRGQHGRSWTAPAGSSVLLSILLFPPPPLRRPALLTAWAAVSVCETITQLAALHASIKWPNDVLIDGRKVCGILIEQGRGTVAGIGLNLNQIADHFQVAGLEQAGSLALVTHKHYDGNEAARLLIGRLDEEYDRLCRGDCEWLETRWVERLGLLGGVATAECTDGEWNGRVAAIGWYCVQLETSTGTVKLTPETIRHLRPA